ncbi:MAG TPA: tRNA guanosine(15) transglycosylase TgtA [Candidatus Nitrosotenuis sp.]|nr:tRNA guanosine(15) transglycosylase TgtA [Candidatus Nitrosotenuis sp.]
MFEILKSDLAGRIGILHTNHGKVETPAYVPVVHPVNQKIPPQKLRQIGFDLVITNAYITMKRHGEEAVKRGIHQIINFDGAVMTDSGGYQVLEYGEVDVSADNMATFERGIKTDIAIPLDRPTGYGLSRKKAASYVEHTLKVSKETLDSKDDSGQIWVGPIQGAEHLDLVRKSTKELLKYGYQMLAFGSPVEVMESYEYRLLAKMILEAKKIIPASIPLHLFGAGHPLTIPIAIALGYDTFDSASYMLYAKHDRYISEDRTNHLAEMQYFDCCCEVCSKHTPKEISEMPKDQKTELIALHNLYAIKAEVDRTKQAIYEGRLWEYVTKKIRAHPKLYEAIDVLTGNSEFLGRTTPKFKENAAFLFSSNDQFRPEVLSYHKTVRGFKSDKKELVIVSDSQDKPFYLSKSYRILQKKYDPSKVQFCQFNPVLGIIPLEISDLYPAAHYLMSNMEFNPKDCTEFEMTWKKFFANNKFRMVHIEESAFLNHFKKQLAKSTKTRKIKMKKKE